MARSKAISVKIATDKVIKALEKALETKLNHKSEYAKAKKAYDKAIEKWEAEVVALAKGKPESTSVNDRYYYGGNNKIQVSMNYEVNRNDVPEKPEAPEQIHDYTLKEQIEEIENAIRILKMTDEEVVSTSTYNAVARYL